MHQFVTLTDSQLTTVYLSIIYKLKPISIRKYIKHNVKQKIKCFFHVITRDVNENRQHNHSQIDGRSICLYNSRTFEAPPYISVRHFCLHCCLDVLLNFVIIDCKILQKSNILSAKNKADGRKRASASVMRLRSIFDK